jgi:uncharacterized protein
MSKIQGFGLGLRSEHYEAALTGRRQVDWFEILTENYLVPGGRALHHLERIRAEYPVVMHGVSLSIGSTAALNKQYLRDVRALADRIEPGWVSDHLCWTGVNGVNLHDLMPLPYTEEALAHVAARVRQVQDILGRQILLENVSSYLKFSDSDMSEWEFLQALAERADCLILLDVNNIHVSAVNHGFAATDYLQGISPARVAQIHLAGHLDCGTHLIDTHDAPVPPPVWDLYGEAVQRFGAVPAMIERDANIPAYQELIAELGIARAIAADAAIAKAA